MKSPLQIEKGSQKLPPDTCINVYTIIRYCTFALLLICFAPSVKALANHNITAEINKPKSWKLSGIITDDEGNPLSGVTVKADGTSRVIASDPKGKYAIEVDNENSTLTFSFIGFKSQTVKVGSATELNITLELESSSLKEVIVTGYSSQAKQDITGSVTIVNSKDLKAVPASNFAQQLQGRAAGVQIGNEGSPGGNVMVRIRGIGSITGNSEPLYVIDGVPTQGDLNLINADDIETIQILKDASTASIYGSRASNGVVIITTKRGKVGDAKITFDSYFGIQTPKSFKTFISPQQNADILWQGLRNSGQVSATTGNPVHPIYGSGATPVLPDYLIPAGAMEGDPRADPKNYSNDLKDPQFGVSKYLITRTNKNGTDWYDVITNPARTQDYNLTVSGGSEKGRYAISASYLEQNGIIKYSSFKRYSLRVNTEFLVKKHITIGENFQFIYADKVGVGSRSESSPIGRIFNTAPIQPVYDIMGNFSGNRDFVVGGPNPLSSLERNKDNHAYAPRLFGNLYAEVNFLKDFKFKTSLGVDYSSYNYSNFWPLVVEDFLAQPKIAVLDVGNSYSIGLTWANTITYTKTFAQDHRITVLAGTEAVTNNYKTFGTQKTGFNFEDLDYRYLDAGINLTNSFGSGSASSLFSLFAKADYAFKDRYLLSALVRRDASSRFSPKNRWGTFPAFSAGWRVTEEGFMKNNKIFSELKLRAGWGQTGNQEIDPYNQYNTYVTNLNNSSYDINGTSNSVVPGYRKFRIGNPDARWEAQTMTNVGIDMSFFQNKLNVSIDAYRRSVSDLLLTVPIPATDGQNIAPAVNIGAMRNDGIDVELTYRGESSNGDFKYTLNGNWSTYNNKVTSLYGTDNTFITGFGTRIGALTRTQVGHPISEFFGYQLDGIFQSQTEADAHPTQGGNRTLYNQEGRFKFRDVNGDNVIDDKDQTFIGSPIPDFMYGLNINLAYKNFDMTMFLQGVYGNKIFNYNRYFTDFFGLSYNYGPRMLDSWTPDNRDAKLPKLNPNTSSYESQSSSYYVESGSYLRAKNVQLGYNFSPKIINKIGIDRLRVYLQAQNLFTITKYTGLDPEVNLAGYGGGADRDIGVDRAIYPIARTFLVGIQLGL
jgi:TonB-linked SusC/RagA family outer membrane protein